MEMVRNSFPPAQQTQPNRQSTKAQEHRLVGSGTPVTVYFRKPESPGELNGPANP